MTKRRQNEINLHLVMLTYASINMPAHTHTHMQPFVLTLFAVVCGLVVEVIGTGVVVGGVVFVAITKIM